MEQRPKTAASMREADRLVGTNHRSMVRLPAVPVTICFAIGVALDRCLGWPETIWLLGGFVLLGGSLLAAYRSERAAVLLLLSCALFVGGARHHQFWTLEAGDDISRFATEDRRPVRLIGTLASSPRVRETAADSLTPIWAQHDRTDCLVRCKSLVSGNRHIAVSGLAQLTVSGRLKRMAGGDDIEIRGWMFRPFGSANPGGFDMSENLRRRGVRTIVQVKAPAAVQRLSSPQTFPRTRWLSHGSSRLRERCDSVLKAHLDRQTYPVASALLLGVRSHISAETRTAFARSGTVHLLSISGLHVGILAGFFWLGCRLFNLTTSTTALVVITAVCGYALLTDGRPPIVRATVFIVIAGFGHLFSRRSRPANALALSALVLLVWNPTDLFNIGAQLSFLAVTGILNVGSLYRASHSPETISAGEAMALESLLQHQHSRFRQMLEALWRRLKQGGLLSVAVCLWTAPLVAARFHLVSPVGLLLNVLLIPAMAGVLGMGYALLLFGVVFPWLATPFGIGFDAGLSFLLAVVEKTSNIRVSSLFLPGPANWWLIGYYGLLAGMVLFRFRPNGRRFGILGLLVWTVFGLAIPLIPTGSRPLRCTFLSVGHGCAVLVEMPHGRTLLYDAGSILSGRRAQRAVQSTLWTRGQSHIDGVVISHADIDHFNGLPGLLQTMPIGSLLVSPAFLDSPQRRARDLIAAATAHRVPLQVIQQGDRLLIDKAVSVRVLHPNPKHLATNDNANSIVLLIEFAGRRLLLTGDLEKNGLSQLLSQKAQPVDVLLSPHHGSRPANTSELADWANPKWVIVSGSRLRRPWELRAVYGHKTQIVTTSKSGAVTVTIHPDGSLQAKTHRHRLP